MIDDSALLHARYYDPAKARAYYLRTRRLKGRRPGSTPPPAGQSGGGQPQGGQGTSAKIRASRRMQLKAQREALEKRLDALRDVLARRVSAAKARSGVKEKPDPKTSPKETAAKKEQDKNAKPLTPKQKREKAAEARKKYQEEQGTTLAQDVQQLQEQIIDIRAQITASIREARQKSARSQPQTASKGR